MFMFWGREQQKEHPVASMEFESGPTWVHLVLAPKCTAGLQLVSDSLGATSQVLLTTEHSAPRSAWSRVCANR